MTVAGFTLHGGGVLCRPCANARKAADLWAIVSNDGAEGVLCSYCGLPLIVATAP
jgi:hypothetical protein